MLRKVGLTTALLLALPAFANAWTLSAKIGSGAGSITSDEVAGSVQKTAAAPVIGYFNTKSTAASIQHINLSPGTGNLISTVFIDGVNVTALTTDADGNKIVDQAVTKYAVTADPTTTNHSVVVYYTSQTTSMKLNQTTGGSITVQPLTLTGKPFGAISRTGFSSLKAGAKVRLTATPNSDYKLTALSFNDEPVEVLYKGVMGDVPYADVVITSGANTATATFVAIPKVTARIAVGEPVTSINGYPGWANSRYYTPNQLIKLDVKTTGSNTLTAYLPDGITKADGATFTGETGVQFANIGSYIVKVEAKNGTAVATAATPIIRVVAEAAANASACLGCHETRNYKIDFTKETRTCSSCHGAPADPKQAYHENGKVTEANGNFGTSKHWNNTFEYNGVENGERIVFTGGAVPGQINPNESWTTLENGVQVTCSTKCHFKNKVASGTTGCDTCHSDGLKAGGSFKNASTTHGGRAFTSMVTSTTCDYCHTGSKHGKIPNAFYGSKHFTNSREYSYYNSPTDFGIFYNGAPTLDTPSLADTAAIPFIDPNNSWNVWEWNAEDGKPTKAVTCAVKCHFKPNLGPDNTTLDSQTFDANGNVVRPGRDLCMACHDPHKPELAKGVNVCVTCHKGTKHETTTHMANHATVTDCVECHNPHGLTTGLPHSNYTTSLANPGYRASYVTPRTACETCHWAGPANDGNDAVRKAWAESGHGDYTASPWKNSAKHDWKNSGTGAAFATTLNTDCVRCHTAAGFERFVTSGYSNISSLKAADKESEPLACNACHVGTDGTRLPAGPVNTFYNLSTVDKKTSTTLKSHVATSFPNVGDSNLCVGCHAGRISGDNVAALATATDWSNISFQNSHYMPAAGLMYMKSGFINFVNLDTPAPANTEDQPFSSKKTYRKTLLPDTGTPGGITGGQTSVHRMIGTLALAPAEGEADGETPYLGAGTDPAARPLAQNGPCVNCHIQAFNPDKGDAAPELNPLGENLYSGPVPATRTGAGHSLSALDQDTIKQICLPCHAHTKGLNLENFMEYKVNPAKVPYQDTLDLIKKVLLANYNISYDQASYPYFFDENLSPIDGKKQAVTDWTRGRALTPDQAYKLHGACFNLNLLAHDPGGYVHARTYTQRLQYDTIDFLDNMTMDFSALNTAREVYKEKFFGDNANTGYVGTAHPVASEGILWLSGTHPNGNEIAPPDKVTYLPLKLRP